MKPTPLAEACPSWHCITSRSAIFRQTWFTDGSCTLQKLELLPATCWYAGKIICGCIIGIATNVYCCYTYYTSTTVHVHCTQTVTHCLGTPWHQEFGLWQTSHHPTARHYNSGHAQQPQTVFLVLQATQPQRRSFCLAAFTVNSLVPKCSKNRGGGGRLVHTVYACGKSPW